MSVDMHTHLRRHSPAVFFFILLSFVPSSSSHAFENNQNPLDGASLLTILPLPAVSYAQNFANEAEDTQVQNETLHRDCDPGEPCDSWVPDGHSFHASIGVEQGPAAVPHTDNFFRGAMEGRVGIECRDGGCLDEAQDFKFPLKRAS
eukprot:1044235-Rhodomonas_salina.1